jgi:hypothetical protein
MLYGQAVDEVVQALRADAETGAYVLGKLSRETARRQYR